MPSSQSFSSVYWDVALYPFFSVVYILQRIALFSNFELQKNFPLVICLLTWLLVGFFVVVSHNKVSLCLLNVI